MPTNTAAIWRFGVFEFDARNGEMRRAGVPINLREQSSRILVYYWSIYWNEPVGWSREKNCASISGLQALS
jgi:hypothetical protein